MCLYSLPVFCCKFTDLRININILLKALPPVCMKCLAQGESHGVANIAYVKSSAIFVTRLSPRAVYLHINKMAML